MGAFFHVQKSLKNLIKPIDKYDKMVYNIDEQGKAKGGAMMENRDAETLVELYRSLWERASDELDRAKRQLEDLKQENAVLRRVIDRQYERRVRREG